MLAPEVDEPDIEVIKTILAITNDPNRRPEPYHVVAEIHEPSNLEAARLVGKDEVELVVVGDVVSRIIAQTCRQAGLSIVYGELLDFDGDEIYFSHQPALAGRTFGEAQLAFEESTLIGLSTTGRRARASIPPPATVIGRGRPADPDRRRRRHDPAARWLGARPVDHEAIIVCVPTPVARESTLVLGWNHRVMPDRARARLVRRAGLGDHRRHRRSGRRRGRRRTSARSLANQELRFVAKSSRTGPSSTSSTSPSYQHVLVVSPTDRYDAQRADARTLVTLLHLRDIASTSGIRSRSRRRWRTSAIARSPR